MKDATVKFEVRTCSKETHEFNGKNYYYVTLYDITGHYFTKAIPEFVEAGDSVIFGVRVYKGATSLQYLEVVKKA